MKNTVTKLLIALTVLFSLNSCNKDDVPTIDENENGSYKVYIDGNLFSESSDADITIINGDLAGAHESNDIDFGIFMYNIPAVGQTVDVSFEDWVIALDNGDSSKPMVKIAGTNVNGVNNEAYMFTGTITRVSNNKVTFTGIYKEWLDDGASHTFNGEVVAKSVVEI